VDLRRGAHQARDQAVGLRSAPRAIFLAVAGPAGDWTPEEQEAFGQAGAAAPTLGPHVLRIWTAAKAAAASWTTGSSTIRAMDARAYDQQTSAASNCSARSAVPELHVQPENVIGKPCAGNRTHGLNGGLR
jgi:hypothetical protein